jgi:hydrogenase expression/formation protein HypE
MGVNPYMIDGSGGALFVCSDGIKVKKALQEAGYEAELIGKTTATRDRVIIHDDERRFLTPPRG